MPSHEQQVADSVDPASASPAAAVNAEEWLTPERAARHIGVAKVTLARWRVTGEGPPFHRPKPRMVRYSRRALDEWLGARLRSTGSGR